ncbi:hypothetical protein RAA17_14140 [Komagataeibacter rhaeticus]|nr:hypothetical protein [Komagataeibacter rhaeticus]
MFSTLSRPAALGLCVLCAATFTAITSELAPVGCCWKWRGPSTSIPGRWAWPSAPMR